MAKATCTATKSAPGLTRVSRSLPAALLSLAMACGNSAHERPNARATASSAPIELLVANDPETLDPRYVTDAVGMRASRLVHAGLSRIDPASLRPVPYVAASFQWVDALTLDVTLRADVRFHGGAPLTAEDVVATLHALASPEVASRHLTVVEAIGSVTAESPTKVRIALRYPHATLLSDLEVPILRRDQAFLPASDVDEKALDGLGPYEVERFDRGELWLRPSRFGVGGPAAVPVTIRTVHDENARALRLYSGRADIALNAISPTLLPALEEHPGLSLVTRAGANLSYLVVRVDRGPLADRRVRRAVSFAIDRQTLTDTLFSHRAEPARTALPERYWTSPADVPPAFRFDPDAARALLHELGGPPPHLTLLTSTDRFRLTVARTMAQELGEVGFAVEVIPLELGTLLARLNAGDFDLASLQLPELVEPNTLRVFLHSASIPPAGSNRGRIRDDALDASLDLGAATSDESSRERAYAAVEQRLRDQLFIIPLWHEDQVAVVSDRARGFLPSPEGRWLSLASLGRAPPIPR